MKEVAHILESSLRVDKPNVGNRENLERTINGLTMKINRLHLKLRGIGKSLRYRALEGVLDVKLLEDHEATNKALKDARMQHAEFCYLRNML